MQVSVGMWRAGGTEPCSAWWWREKDVAGKVCWVRDQRRPQCHAPTHLDIVQNDKRTVHTGDGAVVKPRLHVVVPDDGGQVRVVRHERHGIHGGGGGGRRRLRQSRRRCRGVCRRRHGLLRHFRFAPLLSTTVRAEACQARCALSPGRQTRGRCTDTADWVLGLGAQQGCGCAGEFFNGCQRDRQIFLNLPTALPGPGEVSAAHFSALVAAREGRCGHWCDSNRRPASRATLPRRRGVARQALHCESVTTQLHQRGVHADRSRCS